MAIDFFCSDCGTKEYADCSVDSKIWNYVASPNEMLCPLCLDERLFAAGISGVECRFYFVGKSLSSAPYYQSGRSEGGRDGE